MICRELDLLPIAIRVYPEPEGAEEKSAQNPRANKKLPELSATYLAIDTETTVDTSQKLLFGSARRVADGECYEEWLFYPDDLPHCDPAGFAVLQQYVAEHKRKTDHRLLLAPLSTFLKMVVYPDCYKARLPLVGFNLPFDLSRIAYEWKEARKDYAGGFSLGIWYSTTPKAYDILAQAGEKIGNPFRPRIPIKHIDSKRALIAFLSKRQPDPEDLIPEGSPTGMPCDGYVYPGHFLDLRTLGYALTAKGLSLASACKEFGLPDKKLEVEHRGVITPEYIEYNRNDVKLTVKLANVMLEEYRRHGLPRHPARVFSIASIGKLYLRKMGILPVLERQPNFPKAYLGYAESAFFGGRASTHIRKIPMPVVFLDFLSMYTTVNGLMGLWDLVKAREIKVIEHCPAEIEAFLRRMTAEDLFKPETWRLMNAFVRIIPDGDILPLRAKYGAGESWNIGVNCAYGNVDKPDDALWYSLLDVISSILPTGRVPKIVDAFRIEPVGIQEGLGKVRLRGEIEVDPVSQDFFRAVVEERKRIGKQNEQLSYFMKIFTNAASYGIYAQMDRRDSDEKIKTKCYGIDAEPYPCSVTHPEDRGEFFFSPMASLITGGARLMLALLEHSVTELRGTYVMEDTDSMAIVATEQGGLVPCPGGPYRMGDGREAVMALSWKQVEQVRQRFAALNPYNHDVVPGSVLRLEEDNLDPVTGKQRQIFCYSISAKRYCLFVLDADGNPILLEKGANNPKDHWSQHGLGHLLSPTDGEGEGNPEDEFATLLSPTDPKIGNRRWIGMVWQNIIRKALGLAAKELPFANQPAISCLTVSSPAVMKPFAALNKRKTYDASIKPFSPLLAAHVSGLHIPANANPKHFHLIAPFDPNPHHRLKQDWIDQHSGKCYRISVEENEESHMVGGPVVVQTYADVIGRYESHPEPKCAGADGKPCTHTTVGLLQRRHIRIGQIKTIGKESNKLEEQIAGLIHDEQEVFTEYTDPKRDEWQTKILPALKTVGRSQLEKMSGMSPSALKDILAGRSRPHRKNQELLISILRKLCLI